VGHAWRVRRRRAFQLLGFVVAALTATLAARASSRRFLFPVHDLPAPTAAPADVVERRFVARDGASVRALELTGPAGARVVVDFHNNRETIERRVELARALRARGLGVLLVEYRGYGASPGSPSEDGLYLDAEAALDALEATGVGPDRVVLAGTSLGTGVAAEMARRGRGDRLVLVTPYTSIPDLVTNAVPVAPGGLLVRDHFDTLTKAPHILARTLVIHGDADEIVPFWMGQRVATAIRGARLVRVAGGRHGDLFARAGGRLVDEIVALGD
jgi:uncharacterized protein